MIMIYLSRKVTTKSTATAATAIAAKAKEQLQQPMECDGGGKHV
jgi:hypothetical protein